jgi:hypothetical protein
MAIGLVRTLVNCGALPPKNTGPINPVPKEEAERIRAEKAKVAAERRKKLFMEATANGEPLPIFKPGRPRKYNTPEEAENAKVIQRREGYERYRERREQGLLKLTEANLNAFGPPHPESPHQ